MSNFVRNPERSAAALRDILSLSDMERLDPFELARHLGYLVLSISDVPNLPLWAQRHLEDRADLWSGAALTVKGRTAILLNYRHPKERMNATLMEELSHVWLRHTPSVLLADSSAVSSRTFDNNQESEAYATGAAALVPYAGLKRLVLAGESLGAIAERYGVSRELVQYRLKITRLWKTLQTKRQTQHEMFPSRTLNSAKA